MNLVTINIYKLKSLCNQCRQAAAKLDSRIDLPECFS